jgi:hypothetical protein
MNESFGSQARWAAFSLLPGGREFHECKVAGVVPWRPGRAARWPSFRRSRERRRLELTVAPARPPSPKDGAARGRSTQFRDVCSSQRGGMLSVRYQGTGRPRQSKKPPLASTVSLSTAASRWRATSAGVWIYKPFVSKGAERAVATVPGCRAIQMPSGD